MHKSFFFIFVGVELTNKKDIFVKQPYELHTLSFLDVDISRFLIFLKIVIISIHLVSYILILLMHTKIKLKRHRINTKKI
jgi:hypothetical protein